MIIVNISIYSVSFYFFSKTIFIGIGIGSMKISVFFRYRYRYLLSVKARYIESVDYLCRSPKDIGTGVGFFKISIGS